MRNTIIGLATLVLTLLPASVQAQSFDRYPSNECPGILVDYICRSTANGYIVHSAIPSGYNGRILLGAYKIDDYYFLFAHDLQENQLAAYMMLSIDSVGNIEIVDTLPNGQRGFGGDLEIFQDTSEEVGEILTELSFSR